MTEYKTEHQVGNSIDETYLRKMANLGWELVSVIPKGDGLDYIFKRKNRYSNDGSDLPMLG